MQLGICSYSFHRLLAQGEQDIFSYIDTCRGLGCTQLDPWHGHLPEVDERRSPAYADHDPDTPAPLSDADRDFLGRVKAAASDAGLAWGCLAVDGAYVFDPDPAVTRRNRCRARRWIDIAEHLGAAQIRIDATREPALTDAVFDAVVSGYRELLAWCADAGVELLMENHFGPTTDPAAVVRLLEALPGLGLLLDSNNFAIARAAEGWLRCAPLARHTHLKTFAFTDDGQELTQNLPALVATLQHAGYRGAWGIESVPIDGDERAGVRRSIELLRSCLGEG